MTRPWTRAWGLPQYDLFRLLLGTYLLVHFAHLLPWATELFSDRGMLADARLSPLAGVFPNLLVVLDHPLSVAILLVSGIVAALALIGGIGGRVAAAWMWFLLACLFGRNPLIANPSLPVVGWMLIFHACLPPHDARSGIGRTARVALPPLYFGLAWFLMASAYTYSGWTKLFSEAWVQGETIRWVLENPLARDTGLRTALLATPDWVLEAVTLGILYVELLFAPLALVRAMRPYLWGTMLVAQVGFLVLLNFADLTVPMLLLHLLTFDPEWMPRRRRFPPARISHRFAEFSGSNLFAQGIFRPSGIPGCISEGGKFLVRTKGKREAAQSVNPG